jgi:DNA polymerase III sliding clamp (beta) subunit (PCNA family)
MSDEQASVVKKGKKARKLHMDGNDDDSAPQSTDENLETKMPDKKPEPDIGANSYTTSVRRNKNLRKDSSPLDWTLSFDQPFAFKALIETVSNILKECHFEVKNTDDFKGLAIDSLDGQKSSMIIARTFAGKVDIQTEDSSALKFCISLKTLNSFLQMATAKYSIEIQKLRGSSDVQFNISEADNGGLVRSFLVPTLAKENQELNVEQIKSDYTVEMDFNRLQAICKLAKTMAAPELCFTISEPKESKESQNLRYIHFTISAEGAGLDGKYIERFNTVTEWNQTEIRDQTGQVTSSIVKFTNDMGTENANVNATIQAQAAGLNGALSIQFKQSFSVDYLYLFLKKMQTNSVVMRFSKNNPLILYCALPGDNGNNSYVMLILAPKQTDEEKS